MGQQMLREKNRVEQWRRGKKKKKKKKANKNNS